MKTYLVRSTIFAPLFACSALMSSAPAQGPGAQSPAGAAPLAGQIVADTVAPSKLDYLVFASLADSSTLMAIPYGTPNYAAPGGAMPSAER